MKIFYLILYVCRVININQTVYKQIAFKIQNH